MNKIKAIINDILNAFLETIFITFYYLTEQEEKTRNEVKSAIKKDEYYKLHMKKLNIIKNNLGDDK